MTWLSASNASQQHSLKKYPGVNPKHVSEILTYLKIKRFKLKQKLQKLKKQSLTTKTSCHAMFLSNQGKSLEDVISLHAAKPMEYTCLDRTNHTLASIFTWPNVPQVCQREWVMNKFAGEMLTTVHCRFAVFTKGIFISSLSPTLCTRSPPTYRPAMFAVNAEELLEGPVDPICWSAAVPAHLSLTMAPSTLPATALWHWDTLKPKSWMESLFLTALAIRHQRSGVEGMDQHYWRTLSVFLSLFSTLDLPRSLWSSQHRSGHTGLRTLVEQTQETIKKCVFSLLQNSHRHP